MFIYYLYIYWCTSIANHCNTQTRRACEDNAIGLCLLLRVILFCHVVALTQTTTTINFIIFKVVYVSFDALTGMLTFNAIVYRCCNREKERGIAICGCQCEHSHSHLKATLSWGWRAAANSPLLPPNSLSARGWCYRYVYIYRERFVSRYIGIYRCIYIVVYISIYIYM